MQRTAGGRRLIRDIVIDESGGQVVSTLRMSDYFQKAVTEALVRDKTFKSNCERLLDQASKMADSMDGPKLTIQHERQTKGPENFPIS